MSITSQYIAAGSLLPKGSANGDILYWNGSKWVVLTPIGGTGDLLTVAGGIPSWAAPAPSGPATYRATALQTTTGASLTASTYLQFTGAASTVYYIDAVLNIGNTNAAQTEIGIVAPSGATGTWSALGSTGASAMAAILPLSAMNTVEGITTSTNTIGAQVFVKAVIHVSTTSGTVAIGIASSGGATTSLFADSMMVVYSNV